MIKFFRKIRYDLMEKNKTGKYLKYAIGEIVLVVIGILIALQINNWNEEKKSKQQLGDFLILMLDELSQDKIFLEEGLSLLDRNVSFLNSVSEKKYSDISIEDFPKIIGKSSASKNFGTTYNNLKTEGKFNLIENIELKKSINSYYENNISKFKEWAIWHQKFVSENIEGHIIFNLPIKKGYKTDATFLIDEIENGKYLSMVNYQLTFFYDFRLQYIELIEANQKLTALIEAELKK